MAADGNYFSDGTHEWDAPTLWAWAADLRHPRLEVNLAELIVTRQLFADWEPLTSLLQAVNYFRDAQRVDLTFPILLAPTWEVVDGYHRVVKALLAGRVTLPAVHLLELPPPDRLVAP